MAAEEMPDSRPEQCHKSKAGTVAKSLGELVSQGVLTFLEPAKHTMDQTPLEFGPLWAYRKKMAVSTFAETMK